MSAQVVWQTRPVTVLCYHAVDPRWQHPLSVDPSTFATHVRWLARHRDVVPLSALIERYERTGRWGGGVALTFDDGFQSVAEHAWPVLRRHGFPATLFIVAGTLSEGQRVDWVDDAPPFELPTLDADQLLELHAAGVEIGSHTLHHPDLTRLSEERCLEDLTTSRAVLEELLGQPVRMLAYPRGLHDARVRRIAEQAGYRWAFTLPDGPEPVSRSSLPRVGMYRGNGASTLRIKTHPWYLRWRTSRLATRLRTGRDGPPD